MNARWKKLILLMGLSTCAFVWVSNGKQSFSLGLDAEQHLSSLVGSKGSS